MTMVIAQHSGLLPFGWTGVWLFYVISGYVITRGFLAPDDAYMSTGRRYGAFLWKRFLRIVPVYLLYLLVNVVVLVSLSQATKLNDLPYLLSFTYNWQMIFSFWPGNGGWGAFGHLWTLSVEQQFYLVFPLLALLVPDRWQTRAMLCLLCLGPVLRWQWSSWLTVNGVPSGDLAFGVYAATHCHFDAFIAGALVARWQVRGKASPAVASHVARAAIAVAIIYAAVYVGMNYQTGHRGVQALRNVYSGILDGSGREVFVYVAVDLLAMALLMHVLLARAATKFLQFKSLAWVGRVSYGGYLFHALVLWTLGQWMGPFDRSTPIGIRLAVFSLAWLATVGLATMSYRWFERPLASRCRHLFVNADYVAATPRRVNV